MTEQEILEAAIAEYGGEIQKLVTIEELSELQKAIVKQIRYPGDYKRVIDIAEEMADVWVMLKQLTLIYGVGDEVERWKQKKLKRLLDQVTTPIIPKSAL